LFQTVEGGKPLELRVKVTGHPRPEVKIYRDDVELNYVVEDDDVYVVKTADVSVDLGGHYRVAAVNSAGQAEHVAVVTVTGKIFYMSHVHVYGIINSSSK